MGVAKVEAIAPVSPALSTPMPGGPPASGAMPRRSLGRRSHRTKQIGKASAIATMFVVVMPLSRLERVLDGKQSQAAARGLPRKDRQLQNAVLDHAMDGQPHGFVRVRQGFFSSHAGRGRFPHHLAHQRGFQGVNRVFTADMLPAPGQFFGEDRTF